MIPIRGTDGRQIVLPRGGASGLRRSGSPKDCYCRGDGQESTKELQSSRHVPIPSDLAINKCSHEKMRDANLRVCRLGFREASLQFEFENLEARGSGVAD